jgi:hypothetical protein
MKKVREAQEAGSAQDAEASEHQEDGPLREPGVTLAKEKGRWRTAEVRGRATGGRGRGKNHVETRARGRATSARGRIEDAIGPNRSPGGWLVLEDGAQQDEKVTFANGDGRGPIASRPFARAKGRMQDAGNRRRATKARLRCAKSSAVARFRPARSAKRSRTCSSTEHQLVVAILLGRLFDRVGRTPMIAARGAHDRRCHPRAGHRRPVSDAAVIRVAERITA